MSSFLSTLLHGHLASIPVENTLLYTLEHCSWYSNIYGPNGSSSKTLLQDAQFEIHIPQKKFTDILSFVQITDNDKQKSFCGRKLSSIPQHFVGGQL